MDAVKWGLLMFHGAGEVCSSLLEDVASPEIDFLAPQGAFIHSMTTTTVAVNKFRLHQCSGFGACSEVCVLKKVPRLVEGGEIYSHAKTRLGKGQVTSLKLMMCRNT